MDYLKPICYCECDFAVVFVSFVYVSLNIIAN